MHVEHYFEVIFEDADLLVVNKPAGLVCHPTKAGPGSSLISRARLYLGEGSRPQLVNRLDRETSGVTVVGKSETATRQLRRLWEQRQVRKEYLAIVHGHMAEPRGIIEAPLGKDDNSKVAIKDCVRMDGLPARTEYVVEKHFLRPVEPDGFPQPFSLVRAIPGTGRKHQIRIHLQHLGHAIVGDKLYGGDEDLYLALVEDRLSAAQRARLILPHHALHAALVAFPWAGRQWSFPAKPEAWFTDFLSAQPE